MSLPEELKEPIEDLKNPILKILIIILILGIMFTSGYAIRESGTSKDDLKAENDRLRANEIEFRKVIETRDSIIAAQNLYIINGIEEDKKRLVKRNTSYDSVIASLQYANEKLKEKYK